MPSILNTDHRDFDDLVEGILYGVEDDLFSQGGFNRIDAGIIAKELREPLKEAIKRSLTT